MSLELRVRGGSLWYCFLINVLLARLSFEEPLDYLQNPLHSRPQTSLIVGAGINGLSTAYHLAKEARRSQDHRIIVIDALEAYGLASSHNSGILSFQWLPDEVKFFGEYTYRLYENLAEENRDFRENSGYRSNVSFAVRVGNEPSVHGLPDWFCLPNDWHAEIDPIGGSAIINPMGLGKWLLQECRKLGVEIHNRTTVTNVRLSESGELEQVWLSHGEPVSRPNLVLAAGAWTPGLFRRLFPASSVDFQETINSGNWIIAENSDTGPYISEGQVMLDDFVGHQLEFVGRNDGTIWISGLSNNRTPIEYVHNPIEPDAEDIDKLAQYADQFLRLSSEARPKSIEIIEFGRSYRPTSDRHFPIIDKVAPHMLVSAEEISELQNPSGSSYTSSGVFVNTGQGKYGITMGLGSGKLMSQLIMGLEPDIDVSDLALPR